MLVVGLAQALPNKLDFCRQWKFTLSHNLNTLPILNFVKGRTFSFSIILFSSSPTPLSLLPHLLSCFLLFPLSLFLSLLSRLCGLTPIIRTDCGHPTELLLWPNVPYTMILNPIFVLVLFWLLATDLRMWLFTPVSFSACSI